MNRLIVESHDCSFQLRTRVHIREHLRQERNQVFQRVETHGLAGHNMLHTTRKELLLCLCMRAELNDKLLYCGQHIHRQGKEVQAVNGSIFGYSVVETG